jgi:hypothetical protein
MNCHRKDTPLKTKIDVNTIIIDGVEISPRVGVSVSFDASIITVIDSTKDHLEELLHMLGFTDKIIPRLKGFRGFGKFHSTSSRKHNTEDEVFITCDGSFMSIFRVQGQWNFAVYGSRPIDQ